MSKMHVICTELTIYVVAIARATTVIAAATEGGQPVLTQEGWVQGITVGGTEQFRGIPYAAPPIGSLRWRAPQPPPSHSGVFQAATFSPPCVQAVPIPSLPAPNLEIHNEQTNV